MLRLFFTIILISINTYNHASNDYNDDIPCMILYAHVSQDLKRVEVFCKCIEQQMSKTKVMPIKRWIKFYPDEAAACRVVLR